MQSKAKQDKIEQENHALRDKLKKKEKLIDQLEVTAKK